MKTYDFRGMWEKIEPSPEADERIRRTLEAASSARNKEVIYMHTMKRKLPKAAIAAIVAAALLTVTALAVVTHEDFLQSVFGTKGQEDIPVHEAQEPGKDHTYTLPAMDWEEPDMETAEELVGSHVGRVGATASVGSWTLTVDDYIIDENGQGAITYTLASPNGLEGTICDAGYGMYYVSGDNPEGLREILLYSESGDWDSADSRSVVDTGLTTDTELHAVMYFSFGRELKENESIIIKLSKFLMDYDTETAYDEEEDTITFTPESFISARDFTAEGGQSASLSPVGCLLTTNFEPSEGVNSLILHYDDGTDYIVRGEDIMNYFFSYGFSNNTSYVFNRLAEPEGVTSITASQDGQTVELFPAM